MKFIGLTVFLLAFVSSCLHAQHSDSLIILKEVEAKGVRFGKYTPGAKVFTFDSATLASYTSGSVADLLSMHSLASINSYGPEGLSSVSLRGGSSRHVAVIWNGFSLSSPTSGSMNFSNLQSGGSSTMYGSGASTGVIFISDKLIFGEKKIIPQLKLEGGSFGTLSSFSSVNYTSSLFSTAVKIGYQISENNFRFINTQKYGDPAETLKHAAFDRFAFSQQNAVKIGKISKIETNIWYSKLDKEVPSLMSDLLEGTANQTDESIKSAIHFTSYGTNWSLLLRSGIFSGVVAYFNPVNMTEKSLNKSLTFINDAEYKLNIGSIQNLNIGVNYTSEFGKSGGYISDTNRNRYSVYGRYNISPLKDLLTFSFEGRKEFIEAQKIPFVYSFSGEFEIITGLSLKSVISKHYSLPVFDDLFWGEDGFAKGNPNLRPESGYNTEVGIKYAIKDRIIITENELTFYSNKIDNLIVWLPDSTSKYTPSNIRHSEARGIEFSGSVCQKWQLFGFTINYSYGITDARVYNDSADKQGYQRFYVPKHKASISTGISYKNFLFSFSQVAFSKRYVEEVNTLPAYFLGNLQLNYNHNIKNIRFIVFVKINNVFNTQYQIMNGYAQPLRNYSLGINLSL
jgi:iron complex outermembrane receptor protein